MPLRVSEALVLDAVPARERDKVVTLFTEDEGKIRGLAHGAARSVRRFGGRLERMSRVRARWFEKEGVELVRIDDLELIEESFRLQQDIRVAAALAYVGEIAEDFAREREADRRYYRLLLAVLDAFRAGARPEIVLRYFEFWTARLHGIFPELTACDACGRAFGAGGARIDPGSGSAVCARCARSAGGRSLPLGAGALAVIDAFRRAPPAALARVAFERGALREVEAAAGEAITAFTGRAIRSRGFLMQVLGSEERG